MNKLEELFDSVVLLTTRFPLTLVRLLFSPKRAFDTATNCSAGTFFVIVVLLGYIELQAVPVLGIFLTLPSWLNTSLALIIVSAYFTILISIQRTLLTKLFKLGVAADEFTKALFFPLSMLFLVGVLLLPVVELRSPFSVGVMVISAHVLYCWTLFNLSRAFLGLPIRQSFVATIVGYGAFMFIPILIAGSFHFIGY